MVVDLIQVCGRGRNFMVTTILSKTLKETMIVIAVASTMNSINYFFNEQSIKYN